MTEKKKKVVFEDTVSNYANLRVRLKHDKLRQKEFFCFLVESYLESDPLMLSLVDKLKDSLSRINVRARRKSTSEILEGQNNMSIHGLSEFDREEIYDLIEEAYEKEER